MKAYLSLLVIYTLPPLLTLFFFMMISRNLKTKDEPKPPLLVITLVLLHFCLIFMLLANSLLGQWGGIEVIALTYFLLISPLLVTFIGYQNFKKRQNSSASYWLFTSSINYMVIYVFTLLALFKST